MTLNLQTVQMMMERFHLLQNFWMKIEKSDLKFKSQMINILQTQSLQRGSQRLIESLTFYKIVITCMNWLQLQLESKIYKFD